MIPIILGTRGSALALAQTDIVKALLLEAHPELIVTTQIIKTTGDLRLDISLSAPGTLEKGLFTKELEEAMLGGEIDAAIHSLKDLPTESPQGLVLGAILKRADPSDILISKHPGGLSGLPPAARVATSSPRRKYQLLHLRPDLNIDEIRGNVPTRLRKLAESETLDALLIAKAGVDRLGHHVIPNGLHSQVVPEILPAPGQGAIAVECRADDANTLETLKAIHHEATSLCVTAERDLLRSLGGGCHMPLGVSTRIENDKIHLRAGIFEPSGVRWIEKEILF